MEDLNYAGFLIVKYFQFTKEKKEIIGFEPIAYLDELIDDLDTKLDELEFICTDEEIIYNEIFIYEKSVFESKYKNWNRSDDYNKYFNLPGGKFIIVEHNKYFTGIDNTKYNCNLFTHHKLEKVLEELRG